MAKDLISDAPPPLADGARSGRWWFLFAGIVLALLVVGGVWAVAANRRDDSPSYDTVQIGWMHQGCQQWADSASGSGGPNQGWCTAMTDWMNGQLGSNPSNQNGMMTGPMMWQDLASIQATCEQWMTTSPRGVPGGADATAWCGQMADWMGQHMGDWDSWMMNGPMMGDR